MRGVSASVAIVAAILALAVPAAAIDSVVILFGQSNAVGSAPSSDLKASDATIPDNCEIWASANPDTITQLADFYQRPTFGPEVGLAHWLCPLYFPERLVIVKYAIGGTSLYAWSPIWTFDNAEITQNGADGPLYSYLLGHVATVTAGREVAYAGVFMHQGERDAAYLTAALRWRQNFEVLVDALRADLATPDLPIVYGLINPPTGLPYAWTAGAVNRVVQGQLDAPQTRVGVYPVTVEALTKLPDGIHYDAPGMQWLGRRMGEVFDRWGLP